MSGEALGFRYGHVCLTSPTDITFDTIRRMAEAAEIIGIPPGAVVNDIRIRKNYGRQPECEIDIDWGMRQ